MIKNQNGFSLLEVLVAAALAGGLALVGAELFKNQNKGQKTVERDYEVMSVVNEIRGVLSVPENCRASFTGLNPATGGVNGIKKLVQSDYMDVFRKDTDLPGGISITNYRLSKSHSSLLPNETLLRIDFSRGKGTIKENITRQIKIIYTTAGGVISTCYAGAAAVDTLWNISEVVFHDIFYSSGRVGIGVSAPSALLHLRDNDSGWQSGILLENSGAGGHRFSISSRSDGAPAFPARLSLADEVNNLERVVVTSTGNVGVGVSNPTAKLEINGPVKFGPAPDTCTLVEAGQQRFFVDNTTRRMQYCDGEGWRSMSGGGGLDYSPLTDGLVWSSVNLSTSGGSGFSSGTPSLNLGSVGNYGCGPLVTITLPGAKVTGSTKAALVSFMNSDTLSESPSFRVFTADNRFVGLFGQSGRGGDGKSYGAGGEMVIPLSNRQFRIQGCRDQSSATLWYAVKAVLE